MPSHTKEERKKALGRRRKVFEKKKDSLEVFLSETAKAAGGKRAEEKMRVAVKVRKRTPAQMKEAKRQIAVQKQRAADEKARRTALNARDKKKKEDKEALEASRRGK